MLFVATTHCIYESDTHDWRIAVGFVARFRSMCKIFHQGKYYATVEAQNPNALADSVRYCHAAQERIETEYTTKGADRMSLDAVTPSTGIKS